MSKALLDVVQSRGSNRRPIWFMRQAGRYLPEYREVRAQAGSFLDLCYNPELAAEVTLQPLRRFDLDAAILFADILLIPQAMGCELGFFENEGPRLSTIRSTRDLRSLNIDNITTNLSPIAETIRLVKAQLDGHVSLIGFCGAPWTVASYMIEGGGSDERIISRTAAFENAVWFQELMQLVVDASIEYLVMQVHAGADVLQIFDSWAGDLSASQWEKLVFQPIRGIVQGVRDQCGDIPFIGFARGIGQGQKAFHEYSSVNAVGLEQGIPVSLMRELSDKVIVQGNIDPLALSIGGDILVSEAKSLVTVLAPERHILNLGHGVRQETPPENIKMLVDFVRDFDRLNY